MDRSALFISPHLDDVAFSCGGTLIRLVEEGWRVCLCTVFTASVENPQGFALACQLDKGLSAEVDYMALRRKEDEQFAQIAGAPPVLHLPFYEAPHRGYNSASDLFSGPHEDDVISRELTPILKELAGDYSVVFAPQGIGSHVDHLQVIQAINAGDLSTKTTWYRDTPYVIKNPSAPPSSLLPEAAHFQAFSITSTIDQKIEACTAYETQIEFQFGGKHELDKKLRHFHAAEAQQHLTESSCAESFLSPHTAFA